MPIDFRCAYCNQLMRIGRRKAGSVVRCPKCAGEIIVPTPEGEASPPEEGLHNRVNATFEDQGFERLLQPSATQPAATEKPSTVASDLLGPPRTFPQALQGVFLSRTVLVLGFLAVLLLVLLAFGAGFLVGARSG
jgi:hypothetical protein